MASESKEGAKNEVEMAAAAPTAAEKKASEEAAQIISAMDAVVSSAKVRQGEEGTTGKGG